MYRYLVLPLIALALPAQAELPPCVTDDLMREAPQVVQITNPMVAVVGENLCEFRGVVVAVHRGDAAVDDYPTVTFDCMTRPSTMEIGATIYADPLALGTTPVVEAHIDPDGHVAANGAGLIFLDAATQSIAWEPMCN